jgi:type II secretory pathway predicted ATPase ExeA
MSIEVAERREMDLGLSESAARYVPSHSQLEALKALQCAIKDRRGIALLHGPDASGKRVICRQFLREVERDFSVLRVDGADLTESALLARVIGALGFGTSFKSSEEMKKIIFAFSAQQLRTSGAPIVIIDNLDRMSPGALQALRDLAELKIGHAFVMRFVLLSTNSANTILASAAMDGVASRIVERVQLQAMSFKETVTFLYDNLYAETGVDPKSVFPLPACEALYEQSGGWPGAVLDLAAQAIRNSSNLPVSPGDVPMACVQSGPMSIDEPWLDRGPQVIVTLDGEIVQEIELDKPRILIGRSRRCDVRIDEPVASNIHSLIIRDEDSTGIVDLNSENGTFVNGQRVTDFELRHLDVIALGNHRIKFFDARCRDRGIRDELSLGDTMVLDDAEAVRQSVAVGSEIFPAITRAAHIL